jgi:hypothetical protein
VTTVGDYRKGGGLAIEILFFEDGDWDSIGANGVSVSKESFLICDFKDDTYRCRPGLIRVVQRMLGSNVCDLSVLQSWGEITPYQDVKLRQWVCVVEVSVLSHVGTITVSSRVVNPFFEISFHSKNQAAPSPTPSRPRRTPDSMT